MKSQLLFRPKALLLACVLATPVAALAQTNFNVIFNAPNGTYSAYYADLKRSIATAGNQWVARMPSTMPATTLDVQINFGSDIPR